MMYVFISRHVRISSANSEKVWNTWAVSKSCEEFSPKLKFLFSKNKFTEVWAISESCEVVQTAHVSSPTCASHLLHGLLCGHLNLCPFGFVRVQVTSICSFIWVLDVILWLCLKSRADHLLTSCICVRSLIGGIRYYPVMWLRVSSCHRIGCSLKWVTSALKWLDLVNHLCHAAWSNNLVTCQSTMWLAQSASNMCVCVGGRGGRRRGNNFYNCETHWVPTLRHLGIDT